MRQSICVFCASAVGASAQYVAETRRFARAAVGRGIRVVYGGASVGLMGTLADAVLAEGGEVVGVIPRTLVDREMHEALAKDDRFRLRPRRPEAVRGFHRLYSWRLRRTER